MDTNTLINLSWDIMAKIWTNQWSKSIFSSEYLIYSFIISTLWFWYFIYGKKSGKTIPLMVGLVLMIFPYFVHNIAYMIGITIVLCILPFLIRG